MMKKRIVIEIDEKYLEYIHKAVEVDCIAPPYFVVQNLWESVLNGTPLPKGHRFIDADEILNHAFITEDEEGDIFVQKYYCIKKEIMDNALVLFDTLEADKAESEG